MSGIVKTAGKVVQNAINWSSLGLIKKKSIRKGTEKIIGKIGSGLLYGEKAPYAVKRQNLANEQAAADERARIAAIMPTEDTEAVTEAKRKSLLRQSGRSGRQSTVLTGGTGDTLG